MRIGILAVDAAGAPTNVVPALAHVSVAIVVSRTIVNTRPSIAAAPAGKVKANDTAVEVI